MGAGLLASSSRTTLTALCFRAHALPQSAISLRRSSSSTKIFLRNLFVDFIRIQCKVPIASIWLTPNATILTPAAPLHQKSFCEIFLVMTEDVTIFDYAHSTLLSSACSAAKCNLASSFLLFDKNLSKKSFCRFHKDTMQGINCGHLAYTKCYDSYACFSRAVDSALRSRFLTKMSKTAVRNAHTARRADVHNASLTLFTKHLWQRVPVS